MIYTKILNDFLKTLPHLALKTIPISINTYINKLLGLEAKKLSVTYLKLIVL
jgi:hypothetical protein